MLNGLCHFGNWGSVGNFGGWGWIGMILHGTFWFGLLAGLTLLVIWAIRRARVPAAAVSHASGQPTAEEILQAQLARDEITREEYDQKRRDLES